MDIFLQNFAITILCEKASYSNLIAIMNWLVPWMMLMTFIKFQDWRFRRRFSEQQLLCTKFNQLHFTSAENVNVSINFVRLKCHWKWWFGISWVIVMFKILFKFESKNNLFYSLNLLLIQVVTICMFCVCYIALAMFAQNGAAIFIKNGNILTRNTYNWLSIIKIYVIQQICIVLYSSVNRMNLVKTLTKSECYIYQR